MRNRTALTFLAIALMGCAFPVMAADEEEMQMIADFDGTPPSNLGGLWGVFARSGEEREYVCRETQDNKFTHNDKGMSMRLEYNVDRKDAFNGFWVKFGGQEFNNKFDASNYRKLSFWLKADKKAGVPNALKFELKGNEGEPYSSEYVRNIQSYWKQYSIPLSKYKSNKVNLEELNELVIVFEHDQCKPKGKGRIWIDDIAFTQ